MKKVSTGAQAKKRKIVSKTLSNSHPIGCKIDITLALEY